jgi:serine/threonine protein kinase/tetratricopeptide (TPR) repeat protein
MKGRDREEGERERLLRIAGNIADKTPVSWDEEVVRDPGLAGHVSGLRNVDRVASAHAQIAKEFSGDPGTDLIGAILTHYRIVDRIGAGGMGTVYRARDERLGRIVALKVVHEERVSDETARQVLMREARIAGAIKHPNVAPIFDVGESDGRVFIAMEYVEGETLAKKVHDHPLTVRSLLKCGAQIASALQAVHDAGVVHRDLKSGNISVTHDGWVKVLDFGIAVRTPGERADETASLDSVYGPAGMWAGTVAYMAPELLRGGPPDRRSDIWALGVTLHEALTGSSPFAATSLPELERAILGEDPAPLPRSVPVPLRRVIERCLEKDPGQRYQHASEIRAALEAIRDSMPTSSARNLRSFLALGVGACLGVALLLAFGKFPGYPGKRSPQRSILVLPTRNTSGMQEQQFFAEGLTDDLINTFARLSSISVSGRTTSDAIAREQKPLTVLAREHSLDIVLESSVVRVRDRVRVNVELRDARSDRQIWAQSYERPVREAVTLDHEIARGVASILKLRLSGAELARLEPVPPVDLPVYQAYVLGRSLAAERDYRSALAHYAEATRLDSTFAAAYAGLADCYTQMLYYGDIAPEEALPRAMAAASRALAIDSTQASAHLAFAFVYGIRWDWKRANAELEKALEDEPGSAEALYRRSLYLGVQGRTREEVDAMEHAVSLDPLSIRYANELGLAYLNARRVQDAAAQFRRAQKDGEGDEARMAHAYWARCLVLQGKAAQGVAALRGTARAPATPYEQEELAYALARAGRKADALDVLTHLRDAAERGLASPLAIAAAQLAAGEQESAFATLFGACEKGDPRLVWLGVDQRFDPIRSDPRYRVLMERMHLSPPA